MSLTNILLILILLLDCYNTFIKGNYISLRREPKEEVIKEEDELDSVVLQQQMYNVEKFRERIKKIKEAQDTDEDGLFDTSINVTLEDLGYFTGVEE